MSTWLIAIRAAAYMTAFVLLWGWLALWTRRYDGIGMGELSTWARWVAVPLIAGGAGLALTCAAVFVGRGRGTPAPFDAPRAFVAVGPYKYVRNPMYVGGLALLLGFGLWHRSTSMVGFAFLVGLLVHGFVLFFEEPDLARRFGESYLEYKKSVRRWIPRAPRKVERA